jgi:hypothetical protein
MDVVKKNYITTILVVLKDKHVPDMILWYIGWMAAETSSPATRSS